MSVSNLYLMQLVAPILEAYVLTEQLWHMTEDDDAAKLPALHATQSEELTAPVLEDDEPAWHDEQLVAASCEL
jgi:hypothetical protein